MNYIYVIFTDNTGEKSQQRFHGDWFTFISPENYLSLYVRKKNVLSYDVTLHYVTNIWFLMTFRFLFYAGAVPVFHMGALPREKSPRPSAGIPGLYSMSAPRLRGCQTVLYSPVHISLCDLRSPLFRPFTDPVNEKKKIVTSKITFTLIYTTKTLTLTN